MQILTIFIVSNLFFVYITAENFTNSSQVLSRRKRYVAFPEGSSVSAAICMTIGVIGNPNTDFLSWAVNWGVAYDLPNYAWARKHANGFSNTTKPMVQRRSRRDLYEKIQLALDNMGFTGNVCILRALCESGQALKYLRHRRGNMIEEIIKTVLSFPSSPVEHYEPDEHHLYDRVYRRSKRSDDINCAVEYSACQFSLLDLALGKYSTSSSKFSPGFVFM